MFAAILREQRHTWKIQNHVTIYPICDYAYYPIPGVPGLSKSRRPGTARGPGAGSSKDGCARSAKTAQTWNGKRLWSGLQQGWACQACQNRADLERQEALERAPARVGVPGLSKPRRPGTAPCHRCGSRGCRCARSDKTTQTWNGTMPWRRLYEGQVNFFLYIPVTVAQQIIFYLCSRYNGQQRAYNRDSGRQP